MDTTNELIYKAYDNGELYNIDLNLFADWILEHYDNKNLWAENKELWDALYPELYYGEYFEVVDVIEHEHRRWTVAMEHIIKIKDRYFCMNCDEGLTECQESYYDTSIFEEVFPFEKQIIVTEWKHKEKDE